MPIIEGIEQQTPEWLQMRIGMCTASRVIDVISRLTRNSAGGQKGDYKKAHYDYLQELVVERLTGRASDHYCTPAMEWGIENEPFARAAYEMQCDAEVTPVGFAMHPRIKWFGASPDSLVGDDGCLEIKCPTSGVHLEYLTAGIVPLEHMPQMMSAMACAERQWCDFVSFDPRMPRHLQLFIKRLERNDELISAMESEVETFLAEVQGRMDALAGFDRGKIAGVETP